MDKKNAKNYVWLTLLLLAGGAVLSFLLVTALNGKGTVSLVLWQRALIALAAAVVTAGNYTGFVRAGLQFGKGGSLPKAVKIAAGVFFPVTVVVITLWGTLMLLPSMFQAIQTVKRG